MLANFLRRIGLQQPSEATQEQVRDLLFLLWARLFEGHKIEGLVPAREVIGALSALLGESCFVMGAQFDLKTASFGAPVNIIGIKGDPPYPEFAVGQTVMAEPINDRLRVVDRALRRILPFPASAYPNLLDVIGYVAANVCKTAPGFVSLSVGWPDRPRRMPLREAFDTRHDLMKITGIVDLTPDDCIEVVIRAMVRAFALSTPFSPETPLRVIYEVMCGMAKMVPVPRSVWIEPGTPIGRV